MRKKILFDCDPGIDDALALLMAFSDSRLDVRGVTVAGGNQVLSETLRNTLGLFRFAGIKAEVARGAEGPIMRKLVTANEVHGDTGLGGVILPVGEYKASPLSATELMKKVLEESDDKVILIATGPLTNIATFFISYPHLKSRIEYISLMGGACFGGNQSPCTEFNIHVDPEAADIVFRSGVPIVMLGLDVTTRAFMNGHEIDEIRAIEKKVSGFVAGMLDYYMDFHRSIGLDVVNMHDLCAVAYVLEPDLFTARDCHVDVETRGKLTAGCTVVDYLNNTGLPHNAKVVFDIDRPSFVRMFINAVRSYD